MDAARDPFEELTDLFLSDDPAPDAPARDVSTACAPSPAVPRLTVAICGHLPVMAGLWVTQYADRVAETHGPTGLVRLEGGRCSIEVFRSERRVDRPEGTDLAAAAGLVAEGIRRWVVCVDDRDAAEAVRAGADEVVILTAAEQPAVIEAYRLAKGAAARVAAEHPLDLGLVVVGADQDRARGAADVLSEASARHLDRPLPVIATVRRLDVVEGSQRFMFEESVRRTAQEVVTSIRASLDQAGVDAPEPASGSTPEADPAPSIRSLDAPPPSGGLRLAGFVEPTNESQPAKVEPVNETEPPKIARPGPGRRGTMQPLFPADSPRRGGVRPVRLRPAPTAGTDGPAFDAVDEPLEVETSPSADVESAASGPGDVARDAEHVVVPAATDWSRWIDGVSIAKFRCPVAPEVEFGLDDDGGLHLMCGQPAMGSIHVAEAWLKANRDLVSLATGFKGDVVLHVFTRDAPAVADLHRTGVRLHLIVDDGDAGRCLPLNTASNASAPA